MFKQIKQFKKDFNVSWTDAAIEILLHYKIFYRIFVLGIILLMILSILGGLGIVIDIIKINK